MGKGTEGLQKMREEFEAENEGITIATLVPWLANRRTIRERRQNGEIAASSVVFVVMGNKVAQSFIKKGIKAVWRKSRIRRSRTADCVGSHENGGFVSRSVGRK